jgi:hypothetical protein
MVNVLQVAKSVSMTDTIPHIARKLYNFENHRNRLGVYINLRM